MLNGNDSCLGDCKLIGQHISGEQGNKAHLENFLEKSTVRNTPLFIFMLFQSSLSSG